MRARRLSLPTLALIGAVSCGANGEFCIERPQGSQVTAPRAPPADRSRVQDLLVSGTPNPRHPVGAVFDSIELVGYDVTPEPASRGSRVRVTVYYRALEDIADDWEIFWHMEDQAKVQQRFNVDHYPAMGRMRTNQWRRGDVVRDEYTFTFPQTETAIEMWTGFFQDNDRLTLSSAGRGLSDGTNRLRVGILGTE
jgi:hypothetical protein